MPEPIVMDQHKDQVNKLAFNNDGSLLVSCSAHKIIVWDA